MLTKLGSLRLGGALRPYSRPQQLDLLGVAFERDLAGFFAELARFGGAAALRERRAADDLLVLPGLRLGLPALRGELLVDLFDRLVDEGARADHDLHGAQPPKLPAGTVEPALASEPGGGDLAREAPLEPHETADVGAEQQLLQSALHHHVHGLFAEGAVEALRGPVAGAGAPHEGVGGGAGVQTQRERGATQTERHRKHDHQQRPADGGAGEGG